MSDDKGTEPLKTDGETPPPPDENPPQPWLPMHMPCPRCASKPKAQVTPKFNRILVIQCGKCGWKLDIEVQRQALKTEHFKPDEVNALDDIIETT